MRYWNDTEFVDVVSKSKTISQVLRHFGFSRNQGHYHRMFHETVEKLNVDTSHFTNKGVSSNKKHLQDILTKDSTYNSRDLKKRLIKDGLMEDCCTECGTGNVWNGKHITLHLDHINGQHNDNRLNNLRILCPNCHSQTETWCGRSSKKKKTSFHCEDCGKEKTTPTLLCKSCVKRGMKQKIEWPSIETLKRQLQTTSCRKLAPKLGVSDTALRKRLMGDS
jgi:hypothetical protein